MSWDGKNFDKPLIMLDYKTPQDAIKKNNYQPDEDVAPLIKDNMTSERLILTLRNKGMIKEACDFMSYCVNRRVGVWWSYSCVKAVNTEIEEEFKKNPLTFEEKVKEDAGKKIAAWKDTSELDAIKDKYVSDAAKTNEDFKKLFGPEITDPNDPLKNIQDSIRASQDKARVDFSLNEIDEVINKMDPQKVSAARKVLEKTFARYEAKHGIHPRKVIENEIMQSVIPEPMPEDTTLRDQYYGIIKSRIEEVKKYVNQTMAQSFPINIPGLPKKPSKKKVDDALYAVKRWILTPTDENGKTAMESAKPVPNDPEGMCALTAYWSSADLTPGEKTQLVSPPGLYSTGVKNTVFMCAMKKGGSKTYDERYEEYFNLGIDCVSGVKTWDKEWKKKPAKASEKDDSNHLESSFGFGREDNGQ